MSREFELLVGSAPPKRVHSPPPKRFATCQFQYRIVPFRDSPARQVVGSWSLGCDNHAPMVLGSEEKLSKMYRLFFPSNME